MKKYAILSIIALFFSVFLSPKAEAQSYAYRVLNVCPICHNNVYAYYRPTNFNGVIRYTWVPAYHTACASRIVAPSRTIVKYHRGTPYNYAVPAYPSRVLYPSAALYQRGPTPRYSGYVRPGISISITR